MLAVSVAKPPINSSVLISVIDMQCFPRCAKDTLIKPHFCTGSNVPSLTIVGINSTVSHLMLTVLFFSTYNMIFFIDVMLICINN